MTMRLFFILLLLAHGSIHLLGFVKAFGFANVDALRLPIGPTAGAGWLAAAGLFVVSAALYWPGHKAWWIPAGLGVVVSQLLIVGAWADARFGTLANALIAVPVLLALADLRGSSLVSQFEANARALRAASPVENPRLVTAADLTALPPLVRGYLQRVGVVGQPRVINLRATFLAEFRTGRDAPWMKATVEQYDFLQPAARLFFMRATRSGVPFVAFHRYVGTEARFTVRIAGLYPMIDAAGPSMTQSETVTLFNDLCVLAPAALIDAPVVWQTIDATHVRGEYTNAGHRIAAVLTFSEAGDLVNFRSDDRHQVDGVIDRQVPWLTPLSDYQMFGAVRLPRLGETHWIEGNEAWAYGRFVLQRIEYNVH